MNESEQELLAKVLDLFATEFAHQAVLRGGMVLRVLGSARYTNDLDYVFIPYKSKKDILEKVLSCLQKIENSTVSYSLNSRCLRIFVSVDQVTIQVEAKVALEVKTQVVSTREYSPRYNLPKRLIHIVDHSVSLANKLAAWNERRLARDLFDVWFLLQLNVSPDVQTLTERLAKPIYSRRVKTGEYFRGEGLPAFYDFVRSVLAQLTDAEIARELSDYMLPDELAGIVPLLRAGFVKLR